MDERLEVAVVGGPLKKYKVTGPSGAETVMKLNDADADARGLTDADLVDARRTESVPLPADEGAGEADGAKAAEPAPNKARSAANKGRAPRGKGGAGGGG
ncbi:hypothetical protein [Streptomyces youssoufiensis]